MVASTFIFLFVVSFFFLFSRLKFFPYMLSSTLRKGKFNSFFVPFIFVSACQSNFCSKKFCEEGGQAKGRNFMDEEKIFLCKLDENKGFQKEDVIKPTSSMLRRFPQYNFSQDFDEEIYLFVDGDISIFITALRKHIFSLV